MPGPKSSSRRWLPERQFFARIAQELPRGDLAEAEGMARAVFALLKLRIADGEIEDVKRVLPEEVRHLWP